MGDWLSKNCGVVIALDHETGQRTETVDWTLFFPPDERVLALPNWKDPRLYISAHNLSRRWKDSSFYPASRLLARLYRLSLRSRVATGLVEARRVSSASWPLGEFAREAMPLARSAAVLVGTPGPPQKITARIYDEQGEVLGYLKYAEKEAARRRLRQEDRLLRNLPGGAGPELLKFGPFGKGEALLTNVLRGKSMPPTIPSNGSIVRFLTSLTVSPPVPLEAHEWVRLVRERSGLDLDPWLEVLSAKRWPVVVQHGDFAPWNLFRRPDGTLGAIDWEYGTLEGFPHLDLTYYVLQVLALMQRQAPQKAAEYTVRYLIQQPQLALNKEEASVLTRLTAYDAYLKSRQDGQPDDAGLQAWRRRVWEGDIQDI
jgi:hypothetical protein